MKCPVCRVTTAAVEYDKIELDYCSLCHGIWFDKGELELLLDTVAGGAARELVHGLAQRTALHVAEKIRKCPICGRKMSKLDIGQGQEIIIDACGAGHGLWFDGGESGSFIRQLKLEQPGKSDPLYKALFFIGDALGVNPGEAGDR